MLSSLLLLVCTLVRSFALSPLKNAATSAFRPIQKIGCATSSICPSPTRTNAAAFRPAIQTLAMSSADDELMDEETRMEMVRSLQRSFYATVDSSAGPVLDTSTGILSNLPLWRVQWTELLGRSNVLNVHEGTYTNLFETILNGKKPWYVGHLFLPGGSQNLKSEEYRFKLKTWDEEAKDPERKKSPRSAVVGTLLEIVDYRRLTDGRLLLLVHGLERFVVVNAVQTLPYSIADVQILPDEEDLGGDERSDEASARKVRARAVQKSFAWHAYEYDSSARLPLPDDGFLNVADVFGPDLGKVMPFVPFAAEKSLNSGIMAKTKDGEDCVRLQTEESPLELRLLESSIVSTPPTHPEVLAKRFGMSVDQIEGELWQTLEKFCRAVDLVLPSEVLCLLPSSRTWPEELSNGVTPTLSSDYPNHRRQRRLSYSASAFLEQTTVGAGLRQMWLETPDTKSRLAGVLERYNMLLEML